jgi:hypothetical protein
MSLESSWLCGKVGVWGVSGRQRGRETQLEKICREVVLNVPAGDRGPAHARLRPCDDGGARTYRLIASSSPGGGIELLRARMLALDHTK